MLSIKNKKGFTIIEMLIAVFIFSVSLAALMFISARALQTAKEAEKQVVADYLAIEALEAARQIRDSAFLAGSGGDWSDVYSGHAIFPGCGTGAGECDFYYSGYPVFQVCTTCVVFQNAHDNYLHTPGDTPGAGLVDSGYKRTVKFEQVSTEEVFVTVEVKWNGGIVTMHESLFLWF